MRYAIDVAEAITLDNKKYFVRIRTADITNPVVLFLHGGCGSPDRGQIMRYQSPLADKFTLVAWDQRGSGLAYDPHEAKKIDYFNEIYKIVQANSSRPAVSKFNIAGISDGLGRKRSLPFKDKIIIVGHSFGCVLGVWLACKYPNDIEAYVGVGQCVDYVENEIFSYNYVLKEAERVGDKKSMAVLKSIGAPDSNGQYKNDHFKSLMKQRAVLHKLGGATYANRKPYWQELLFDDVPIMYPEYGFRGLIKYIKGLQYVTKSPLAATNPDFMNTAVDFDVPVYLLLGRHDCNCSFELAEKWFDKLDAPSKKLIWFENSAHSPQWEEPAKWNAEFRRLFA